MASASFTGPALLARLGLVGGVVLTGTFLSAVRLCLGGGWGGGGVSGVVPAMLTGRGRRGADLTRMLTVDWWLEVADFSEAIDMELRGLVGNCEISLLVPVTAIGPCVPILLGTNTEEFSPSLRAAARARSWVARLGRGGGVKCIMLLDKSLLDLDKGTVRGRLVLVVLRGGGVGGGLTKCIMLRDIPVSRSPTPFLTRRELARLNMLLLILVLPLGAVAEEESMVRRRGCESKSSRDMLTARFV